MKLSDLKTGMWVKLRNGSMYLVLRDYETALYGKGSFAGEEGFMAFKCYDDNMKRINDHDFDIVEVFTPNGDRSVLNKNELIHIWKEKEIPKLTPFEIEFLKNIKPRFKWFARDENDGLWVYENKPNKGKHSWDDNYNILPIFNDALKEKPFAWLKWEDEEPYYIPNLIKKR